MLEKNYWKLLGFLVIFTACGGDDPTPPDPEVHPVVSTDKVKVLDYAPAPGQFVNELPKYEDGNTQNNKNQNPNRIKKKQGQKHQANSVKVKANKKNKNFQNNKQANGK